MKLRRRSKFAAEVSTASLNDIMFFLMLFFLIVSTIAAPGLLNVALPKAEQGPMNTPPVTRLYITSEKKYIIDNKEFDVALLPDKLKEQLSGQKDPVISLNVDETVPWGYLVKVYDVVIRMNKNNNTNIKVVVATDPNI